MKQNKPLTIMIADDDEDDRDTLTSLFEQNENFELVHCFESGIDAIKEIMVKKNIPDVLLIDMYMPMLTGAEIVKKIEESGIAPNMHKFVVSTTINSAEQNRYIDNPTVKFIRKPFSEKEINDLPNIILEHFNTKTEA